MPAELSSLQLDMAMKIGPISQGIIELLAHGKPCTSLQSLKYYNSSMMRTGSISPVAGPRGCCRQLHRSSFSFAEERCTEGTALRVQIWNTCKCGSKCFKLWSSALKKLPSLYKGQAQDVITLVYYITCAWGSCDFYLKSPMHSATQSYLCLKLKP